MVEHIEVDPLDAPDETDVLSPWPGASGDAKQRAVIAAETYGRLAVTVDAHDDLLVDLADEHHLGDLNGVGIGDPQAGHELDRQAKAFHVGGDIGAAAVHDDRAQTDVLEQHDIA